MAGACICGRPVAPGRRLLCERCAASISVGQRRYVERFEAMLRTGEGIDFCMELLRRIATPTPNRRRF